MRNQLENYVNLLFAGAPDAAEIREEILQNTLDRYDDLVAQGHAPEAAYSLAISGIGDLSELLHGAAEGHAAAAPVHAESEQKSRKLQRAIAVALYILCPVPLVCMPGPIGLSLLLILVALATALMVFSGKGKKVEDRPLTPRAKLKKSISDLIWTIGTVGYFIISFMTMAWHITWLIFPLLGAVEGLVNACLDLKEEK